MQNKIRNLYLYVKKEEIKNLIKYGIKLSEFSNVSFIHSGITKKGILAYLSPKDSDKYFNDNYDILRIKTDNLNVFVHNSSLVIQNENIVFNYDNMCNLKDYTLGDYINPELIICSTIFPDCIYKYNRIIDVPLLIDNSKEFYIQKEIELENEKRSYDFTYNKIKENI